MLNCRNYTDITQSEVDLTDIKNKVRQLSRRINRNSEPQASIESDHFNIQYIQLSKLTLQTANPSLPATLSRIRYAFSASVTSPIHENSLLPTLPTWPRNLQMSTRRNNTLVLTAARMRLSSSILSSKRQRRHIKTRGHRRTWTRYRMS